MDKNQCKVTRRPAIRAGMGNWVYYVSTMTYRQISEYVTMPPDIKELKEAKKLSERIQRGLTDNVDSILDYLRNQPDRFFSSLVLAIYQGCPTWYPGVFEKDEERFSNIGLLVFSGDEEIYPVDGQHRVAAIKKYVEAGEADPDEEVPVLFVQHQKSDAGNMKTRRLFTALNRYAKEVNDSDNIALDEDDIVAITTRHLVDEFDLFNGKILVQLSQAMSITDNTHFTNLRVLNKCNTYLLNSFMDSKKEIKRARRYRPEEEQIKAFEKYAEDFWKAFILANQEVNDFFNGKSNGDLRGKDGGNLLFRPRGLCPYVDAVCTIKMIEEKESYTKIMKKLATCNLELDSPLWKDILWNNGILQPGDVLMKELFIMIYNSEFLNATRYKACLSKFCDKKHISEIEAKKIITSKGFINEKE